jgi:hypothetical protein
MDRKNMIESLIEYELQWLVDNYDKHSLEEVTDFFANGGFHNWTDKQLEIKFNMLFSEEEH